MTAALTAPDMRSVNTVVFRDGREVHLDDIRTAAEGQALLDELDAVIDTIETQLVAAQERRGGSLEWISRAEVALKRKRRMRPRLQQRIGELRKAERQAEIRARGGEARDGTEARRLAFVDAAYDTLDRELVDKVWARAKAMRPHVFEGEVA